MLSLPTADSNPVQSNRRKVEVEGEVEVDPGVAQRFHYASSHKPAMAMQSSQLKKLLRGVTACLCGGMNCASFDSLRARQRFIRFF